MHSSCFFFYTQLFSLDHLLVFYGMCAHRNRSIYPNLHTYRIQSRQPDHSDPTCLESPLPYVPNMLQHPREYTPARRKAHLQVWMAAAVK